jgi:hypothetical protein
MGERAASVGGELAAGPLPDGGFQVRATLPTLALADGATWAGNEPAWPAPGDAPARLESS